MKQETSIHKDISSQITSTADTKPYPEKHSPDAFQLEDFSSLLNNLGIDAQNPYNELLSHSTSPTPSPTKNSIDSLFAQYPSFSPLHITEESAPNSKELLHKGTSKHPSLSTQITNHSPEMSIAFKNQKFAYIPEIPPFRPSSLLKPSTTTFTSPLLLKTTDPTYESLEQTSTKKIKSKKPYSPNWADEDYVSSEGSDITISSEHSSPYYDDQSLCHENKKPRTISTHTTTSTSATKTPRTPSATKATTTSDTKTTATPSYTTFQDVIATQFSSSSNTNSNPINLHLPTIDTLSSRGLAITTTKYILISRISKTISPETFHQDLLAIQQYLGGPPFDIYDSSQELLPPHIIKEELSGRLSILITLTTTANFSTQGIIHTSTLPFLFFTNTNTTPKSAFTSKRYTVQAIPTKDIVPSLDSLHEVCCIRGFPDNHHTISTQLGIILRDISTTAGPNYSLLPILQTTFLKPQTHFVDETFLQLYTYDKAAQLILHRLLNLSNTPILHTALSWKGEISKSLADFTNSTTNNPNLLHTQYTLSLAKLSQDRDTIIRLVTPYILKETPISYVIQLHDFNSTTPWISPTFTYHFVSEKPNIPIHFDKKWTTTYPTSHLLTTAIPGYLSLRSLPRR